MHEKKKNTYSQHKLYVKEQKQTNILWSSQVNGMNSILTIDIHFLES